VTVTNNDGSLPGTLTGGFTVNAAPTVTSLSPSSRGQGCTSQSIAVTGTGFVSGASVSFSGSGVTATTTFVSSTSLTTTVPVAAGAATGARDVTVTNPDAGNGTKTSGFTVNAAPTVTSLSPSSRDRKGTRQN